MSHVARLDWKASGAGRILEIDAFWEGTSLTYYRCLAGRIWLHDMAGLVSCLVRQVDIGVCCTRMNMGSGTSCKLYDLTIRSQISGRSDIEQPTMGRRVCRFDCATSPSNHLIHRRPDGLSSLDRLTNTRASSTEGVHVHAICNTKSACNRAGVR